MRQEQYTLFETPIGTCGVAWTDYGISRLQLPEADVAAIEARFKPAERAAPPARIRKAIEQIVKHLSGSPQTFNKVPLDLSNVTDFRRAVYEQARNVTRGRTCSYADLAKAVGKPGAFRAVGQAMGHNPIPIIIPCHRVLASGGGPGGFSAHGGLETKRRLLELEGVSLDGTDSDE